MMPNHIRQTIPPHPNDGKADAHGVWKDLVPEDLRLSTPTKPHKGIKQCCQSFWQGTKIHVSHTLTYHHQTFSTSTNHLSSIQDHATRLMQRPRDQVGKAPKFELPDSTSKSRLCCEQSSAEAEGQTSQTLQMLILQPTYQNLKGVYGSKWQPIFQGSDFVHLLGGQRNF